MVQVRILAAELVLTFLRSRDWVACGTATSIAGAPSPTFAATGGLPMPDNRPCRPANPSISSIIVLAAGAGTRMRSAMPKVLHPIAGKPLLWHAITAAAALEPDQLVAVIGHGREQVGAYLTDQHPTVRQAIQEEQLGTGHAVASALTRNRRVRRDRPRHLRRRTAADRRDPALAGRRTSAVGQRRHRPDRLRRRSDRLRPDRPGSLTALWSAIVEQKDADRHAARDPRDQLRRLRVRRRCADCGARAG